MFNKKKKLMKVRVVYDDLEGKINAVRIVDIPKDCSFKAGLWDSKVIDKQKNIMLVIKPRAGFEVRYYYIYKEDSKS